MNLQHLRYFLTLTEWKNYHVAAEKLFITQPALSKAIKRLEEELGVPLFVRKGNENTLTKYGKLFYTYVKSSLATLDKGIAHVKRISEEKENIIRIGAIYACATQCVPLSIKEFTESYPMASFYCYQDISSNIVKSIANMEIDIGLISDYQIPTEYRYIEKVEILSYPGLVAVPKGHPLSKKKSVKYEDLNNYPWVSYSNKCGNAFTLKKVVQRNHLKRPNDVLVEYDSESAILSAVEKGLGIGIVTGTKFNRQVNVDLIPIDDLLIEFPVFLCWRSDVLSSSIVNAYRNYVLQSHHMGVFLNATKN